MENLVIISLVAFIFSMFLQQTLMQHIHHGVGMVGLKLLLWPGVIVHEVAHAVFCLLFNHRVEKMETLTPGVMKGQLGYVVHSYNVRSLWAIIGNFPIGIAPLIVGVFVFQMLFGDINTAAITELWHFVTVPMEHILTTVRTWFEQDVLTGLPKSAKSPFGVG